MVHLQLYDTTNQLSARLTRENSSRFVLTFWCTEYVGEIDDIREVVYSMALSRHPNLALDNLEYPYIVS